MAWKYHIRKTLLWNSRRYPWYNYERYWQVLQNNKIIALENDKILLEAILEISRNEIKIPIQYQYVDDAFRKLLNVGATINQIEVIRNFNGWSWNISSNMRNYEYNIIYQTLNYIVGYDLLYEFIDNNNITLDYIKILNEQVVLKMRKQNRKRI